MCVDGVVPFGSIDEGSRFVSLATTYLVLKIVMSQA
jgi:hypothetical protein